MYEISFALLVFLSRDLVSIILFALCEPKRDKQRRNFDIVEKLFNGFIFDRVVFNTDNFFQKVSKQQGDTVYSN